MASPKKKWLRMKALENEQQLKQSEEAALNALRIEEYFNAEEQNVIESTISEETIILTPTVAPKTTKRYNRSKKSSKTSAKRGKN
tara:strand:- start:198 stop:452 length:255 start_codon:yes stop_codon:yes gene_type:complete